MIGDGNHQRGQEGGYEAAHLHALDDIGCYHESGGIQEPNDKTMDEGCFGHAHAESPQRDTSPDIRGFCGICKDAF
jgi:hypothetical protein